MLKTEQRIFFLGPEKKLLRKRIPRRIFICRDRVEVEAGDEQPDEQRNMGVLYP